jgi:hypothetical protein
MANLWPFNGKNDDNPLELAIPIFRQSHFLSGNEIISYDEILAFHQEKIG